MSQDALNPRLRRAFSFFLALLAAFAWVQRDSQSVKWTLAAFAIYGAPLVFFSLRLNRLFQVSFWIAVFVFAQSLFSLGIYRDHATLYRNFLTKITYTPGVRKHFEGTHIIRTDSEGFRSVDPVDYKNKTRPRIFAIGASTTEEIYIDNRKTWTGQLQARLPGFEVINTGLSGLLAIHHDDTLWAIEKHQPDVAVFLMGINDWNKAIRRHYNPDAIKDEPSRLALRKTMLGRNLRAFILEPQPFLAQFKKTNLGALPDLRDSVPKKTSKDRTDVREYLPSEASAEYRNALERIANHCHRLNLKCLWMTQPTGYRKDVSDEYRATFWMTPPDEPYTLNMASLEHIAGLYNKTLVDAGARYGIPVCDLAAEFQHTNEYFYDDCHFNPAGALKVSEHLLGCLKRFGFSP